MTSGTCEVRLWPCRLRVSPSPLPLPLRPLSHVQRALSPLRSRFLEPDGHGHCRQAGVFSEGGFIDPYVPLVQYILESLRPAEARVILNRTPAVFSR